MKNRSQKPEARSQPDLFAGTSAIALARTPVIGRRRQILSLLNSAGPLAIFQIASLMHVHDHQVAGRFCEMEHYGWIAKAGERRIKPETKCPAEVYRITQAGKERIEGG